MTDDRNDAAGPPPEPPAPPPPPAAVRARARPWGWIVAALLAVTLGVLVISYFMGMFDGDRRREEVPWNSGEAAPAPAAPAPVAPAPPATGGQVTEAWLLGRWGQTCPASNDPDLTFQPGGRFLLGSDPGDWTLAGDVVTVRRDGRGATSATRWAYLSQDSAMVTQIRSGNTYTVYRCP